MYVSYTNILNRAYTRNSSLDFDCLFENFTTYNYKISYTYMYMYIIIIVYFSSLHNFVMFKDICKWDLLPLNHVP